MEPRPIAVRSADPGLRVDRRAIARALGILESEGLARLATPDSVLGHPGGLSVVFLTPAALARLHARYLSDPSETDVMTFPGGSLLGIAGEICVSAAAAERFARDAGGDFSEELTLYLVHGWLHLAGHDDRTPRRRRAMRRAEARAMGLLRAAGAVPTFSRRTV